MAEEEKIEKKVAVKEKPLGGTEVAKETKTQQVKEQPSTTAQPSQTGKVAGKSGEVIGSGLKKVGKVLGEFTAGVSKEMKTDEPPKQAEQEVQGAQRTVERSEQREQTQETPQAKVTEKEKVEKKVTKETE